MSEGCLHQPWPVVPVPVLELLRMPGIGLLNGCVTWRDEPFDKPEIGTLQLIDIMWPN